MSRLPEWLGNAVFYEIYPQSFQDTTGDGIGDLPGMIGRLDYIASLGCNAIWVNPWYDSPFGDAGYDVRDYKKIAPRYGTNADAKRFFEAAHARGMHVLIDLVPGHTSIDHPWFLQSERAEKNEFTDRYVWSDSVWEATDLPCLRGISDRNGSVAVNFFSHQPALNYGYGLILSALNREIAAAGYLTQLGVFHDNVYNAFNLGCDLMEPLRPLIDNEVMNLRPETFEKEHKHALIRLLQAQVRLDGKQHVLLYALRLYCASVFRALQSGKIDELRLIEYEL